jgi:hypothetical protein
MMKSHIGIPQQRRLFFFSGASLAIPSFSKLLCGCAPGLPGANGHDVVRNHELLVWRPSCAGGGNAANISDKPDWYFSSSPPSFSPSRLPFESSRKSLRLSKRLAGRLPRSIIAASLVARRMRSGRLVMLPLASISRTASMSSFGGRFNPERRLGGFGDGVILRRRLGPELAAACAPSMASGVTGTFWSPGVESADAFSEGVLSSSRNAVPELNGDDDAAGGGFVCPGARVTTSAGLPFLPMLTLRTSLLSSPNSS